jgi:hypothetical protein
MLCHHFNCVFVHKPKTAGQSIEQVFLKALDLNWDTRAPLLMWPDDNPQLGPRLLAHLSAREYVDMKYMTAEQFSSYFKFTFVRNPHTWLVSIYVYFDYYRKHDFNTFLETVMAKNICDRQFAPQTEFIYDENGKLLVDFIGRFGRLQQDFDHVCDCVGMPHTPLPHANKTKGDDQSGFRSWIRHPVRSATLWKAKSRLKPQYIDYFDQRSLELANSLCARFQDARV